MANQENPVLSPSPEPILGVSELELSSGHTWFESGEDSSTSCLCEAKGGYRKAVAVIDTRELCLF